MDRSSPAPCPLLVELNEPLAPQRSPSRLDFCMEDPEEGSDTSTHKMNWSSTSFRNDCPYTFVEEGAFVVDIAPPAPPRLLIVEDPEDDPPQATDSHAHESTLPLFFAPSYPDPMDEVVIEPRAPIPVRPPSVQIQADAEESTMPSRVAPQRLNYPHHGFSRSALLQQKTLWNSRHEEWVELQSRMEHGEAQKQQSDTDEAYTGLANFQPRVTVSPSPYMRIPPSGLERDLADHTPRRREQDAHASIYPRVGDISALRDPYSVDIDRYFFRLPLWTLHKALYVFDMQRQSASLALSASSYNPGQVQASMSSSTLSSYSSSTSGDDEESDSTLVADDSPVSKSKRPLEPLTSISSPQSPPSWNGLCGWEFSWYARWELLIAIFQRDHARHDAFDCPVELATPVESRPASSSLPEQIFRFTIGGDGNEDYEEEDYGRPLADSSFSVDFDEECERALAFYNRELKSPEAAL